MDDPVDSLRELEANLRDIARANRLFGGIAPIARVLDQTHAAEVLDVGCGGADIPRTLQRRAQARGRQLAITCLDRSRQILEVARRQNGDLTFVQAEGDALPFADEAFDVAMCSLTLHHAAPAEAVSLLRELRRVSRVTPLVCDLRRSALGYVATWLFSRTSRNRMTRHDAPTSVLRAYTPAEAVALAREAGWRNPHARIEPFFRMTLVDRG